MFRNRLLLAALVILVAVSFLLTFTNVKAGQGGGGAADVIKMLL